MKTNLSKELPIIGIVAIPFIYLAYLWNSFPEKVPMHYDMEGVVDRYGSKYELIIIPILLPLLTYLIMLAVPYLDPKKQLDKMGNKFQSLKYAIVSFMSILATYIIYTSSNPSAMKTNILYALVGGLYMVLGNFFKTIKPNYFVGLRTPWTLESPEVWKSTHKLTGILWIIGGLIIIIFSMILSAKFAFIILMSTTAIITLVPIAYSYKEFKKLKSQ